MAQSQEQLQKQLDEKDRFGPTQPVVHNFLPYSPVMQVVEIVRIKSHKESKIVGIRCCWFDNQSRYYAEIFNTSNLRHARPEELPADYKPRVLEKESV